MSNDFLPVLDLYERYRDGETFLTGAFGGVEIFIHPIKGADPDDRSWRMYFAPRVEAIDRDRATPTTATKPKPPGWAGVRERQSMTRSLAAIGMNMRFDQDAQRELGLDDPDPDR
jgi:hypothetical protein